MEKQPLLGFRRGIHNSENTEEKQTLITGAHDADVTVATERHYTKNLAFAIAACVCGSSFMLGYNTGVVNTPATIIKDFYNASYNKRQGTNSSKYLSTISISVLWATTVSVFALGGMIGGLSAGYWCNKYGRKGALLRNNLLHLLSAALMYYSNFINSYEMLIAGRLLVGICAGINSGAAPLYLMEIAPTSLRGFAGVFNQLAINIGILVSQILGLDSVMGTKDLWPCDLGATVVPIVIMLCSLPWCPESPRFLMLTAMDENKAEKALIWLRETEDVGEDMDEMKREAETQTRMPEELNITVVWLPYLAIVSVICYIIAFASGPGSIPWFMVAEIFSQGPRSAAISVSTMVNWFSNFTVGLVFPLLNELAIHQYSFLPFVVLLIIFLNFIYRRVPETKGKTFEQISLLFRRPDMMVYESIIQQDSINTA
ncbi:solute carrier family 2, facilitated glucose transporter member 1 isoform X3 [Magallana gigas]|uniref:solute carrier family 2, facilitated glucose transporter member 1 isoform X3 n=1 Tax=Magallana gigas TaxID=29159 RepID=UPI003341DF3C